MWGNEENAYNGVGTGGTVYINFSNVKKHLPSHILLGHELIHMRHMMKGTVARGEITVDKYNAKGEKVGTETGKAEELATVGLGGAAGGNAITENSLRKESGLPLRTYYSGFLNGGYI